MLTGHAIFANDAPAKMLALGTGKIQTERLWIYGRDERPWGSLVPPAAWYHFAPARKGECPVHHPKGFTGWMLDDGYVGFENLCRSGNVQDVAYMAHIRCKSVDAHRSLGSSIAEDDIRNIAELYAIEKRVRGAPSKDE